jgi:uncharacterized protein YndB with AHSA1/START domain
VLNSEFEPDFGPEYSWRARVVAVEAPHRFVLEMTTADAEWTGTLVAFELEETTDATRLTFRHVGWRAMTDHCAKTSHCWAMYLRILRRYIEDGDTVPFRHRLEV